MTDTKPKVEFEPVETKASGAWHVQATLPSGKQMMLGGFDTEAEAREWIARKSAAWLKLKECEGNRNV
jgi:plasmid replication initiation protein